MSVDDLARKQRLGVYFSIARQLWSDRKQANARLHTFIWSKFGDNSLKQIPNDPQKDRELIAWLSRKYEEKFGKQLVYEK